MKLSTGTAFGVPLVRIQGDVEPDDAQTLERAAWDALGASGTQIVLDFEACTLLSSTGLGVLFSLVRWVRPKEGTVIAIRPSPQILRVLRLVRLVDEPGFQVFGDMESAGKVMSHADTQG